MNHTPSHRKKLNPDQLEILYLLYKFRFGTTDLFVKSHSKRISRQYINVRLQILCDQEYIGRNYDGTYKLQGKPATYYLLPKGIKLLKQSSDIFNPKVLKNIRNDWRAKERSIEHRLQVFNVYCALKRLYNDELKFFTDSYLKLPTYEYFPQPLPDGYVSFKEDKTKHFLLEYAEGSTPFFVFKKRIKYYVSYAEDNLWSKNSQMPAILFVCEDEELRKKVEKQILQALDRSWKDVGFVTTMSVGIGGTDKAIWQKPGGPSKKLSLEDLS